jgi:hypothetical protein
MWTVVWRASAVEVAEWCLYREQKPDKILGEAKTYWTQQNVRMFNASAEPSVFRAPCRSDSLAFLVLTSTCLVSVACFGFKWYDSLPFQCLKIFYNRYQARLCRAVNFGSTYMASVHRDSI